MVIFVHRPDYLGLSETENGKETTQIIIAKHRNGETRDIDMLFKSEQVRFVELDQTLVAQAGAIEYQSAMNMDFPSDGFAGGDEFSNNDFR